MIGCYGLAGATKAAQRAIARLHDDDVCLTEEAAHELARKLRKRGHRVRVVEGAAGGGLGRLTPAQKRVYAARRLVSPEEAIERIRARHGAAAPSLERLPVHIEPFARYMTEAAKSGVPTPRQVVKAYVITRSSVRRQGRTASVVCETFPGYRELRRAAVERGEEIRPEDAMSVLLGTEDGQEYLNAAEQGRFAARAAQRIVRKMRCFGMSASLLEDMRAGVRIGTNDELRRAVRSTSAEDWIALVDSPAVPGIGPAKAGFFASLLGRGDVPTFDAREIALWRRRHGGRDPQAADVHALRERIQAMPVELPRELEPFRQHLVHHALWDAYAEGRPTETTHEEVVHAMRLAGGGLGTWKTTIKPHTEHMRSDERGPRRLAISAYCDDRECGQITIARGDVLSGVSDQPLDEHLFVVEGIYVEDQFQRAGVGTRLYEAAAAFACANGGALATNHRMKGAHSIDFWRKQIQKGRATTIWRHPKDARFNLIALRDCPAAGERIDLRALRAPEVKRGGAAVGRGKYKPLAPGQSAVEQYREVEAARARIIEAIESGRFELCPKGTTAAAAAAAPKQAASSSAIGSRTESEIAAVRERMRRAGY